MRFLFAHGWGFDAGLWGPLRAALGDPGGDAEDRGYFGAPRKAVVTGPYVAVGHSFGALRLILRHADLVSVSEHVGGNEEDGQCLGIVAINGFDRFCGSPGVAPRVLDRMIARLDREPPATVRDFRALCGDDTPFASVDPESLRADLIALRDGDARGIAMPPLLVLHGGEDPILSPEHRATTFAGHPCEIHPAAGHLLPTTHPEWCAARIGEWLKR